MTELMSLDIKFGELRTIELGAFNGLTKLRELLMQGNLLSDILPGTFGNMSSLEHLDLSYNRIKHLHSDVFSGLGAFKGLTKLTELSMQSNKISVILPGTFENMSSLDHLDLSYNRIKHLDSGVMSGLGVFKGLTKLTRLLLVRNKITEIMPGTFENMSILEYLDLSYNRIKDLDSAVFSGLINLKYVDLSANKLQYLHPHTFLGLPNIKRLGIKKNVALKIPTDRHFINSHSLSELDIASCNVSSLSVETFANVSALKSVDLSDNNLRTVDINILRALPELSTLYLDGNPLQCDCQLQELWRFCKYRNIETAFWILVPKCDTPSEVKGMGWGVLEKGQCLDSNIHYFGDYKNTSYLHTGTGLQEYNYENQHDFGILNQYQVPVFAVPFIFCTTSNIIILIIIIFNKDMRTVPNMYILNLALSDIVQVLIMFSEACGSGIFYTWFYSDFTCTFLSFCRRMSVGLSAYSVALYSFQRYRVTVDPFQVRVSSQTTWCGIAVEICGLWIVAALFAIPSTLAKYLCLEYFVFRLVTYYQRVAIFELLVSCVIPLCVIAFSYVMTARHLVESSRSISEGTQNPKLKTRRNTAKIVVGLTVVFVISYVPYHVFWTYFICSQEDIMSSDSRDVLRDSNYELQFTYLISTCFLLTNSCLNPVALFCTSSQLKKHLKRYITCFCKTSPPSSDLALARRI